MEHFKQLVQKHFDLDITVKSRKFKYVFARACYYFLCYNLDNKGVTEIARSVNVNHATVIHSLKELPFIVKHNDHNKIKFNSLIHKFEHALNRKIKDMNLQSILVDYNILVIENDRLTEEIRVLKSDKKYKKLESKIDELKEIIYQLADCE